MWLGGRKEGRRMLCKEKKEEIEERTVKRRRKQEWKGKGSREGG